MEEQYIAFAHYKGDQLLGYRADTFGTLHMTEPKLYVYSKEQVEIVLKGVRYSLGERKETLGSVLAKIGADPEACKLIEDAESKIYEQGQEARAFEVRVVKAPAKIREREFDISTATWKEGWPEYDMPALKLWLEHPENQEIIETHHFSFLNQLNMQ